MSHCPLGYCGGGAETFDRLADLFERRRPEAVCATFAVPTRALAEFAGRHPAGACGYPDPAERIAFWDAHLAERAAVRDDSVPAAYLSEFDQGLYGGMIGGQVRFLCDPDTGWISSMVPALFDSLADADELAVDPSSPWFARYREQMELFARKAQGRFGISHLICIDSLNFVFELIGATASYMAMIEQADRVRRAIDFAFELNVRVQEAFFEHAGLVAGGTCSNMVGWARGRVLNESIDPFHMTSVECFEQWGREPVERISSRFDGGVIHVHGNGRHLLRAASTLGGLRAIYLGDDRGYPPAFSVLADLKRRVGAVPLVVGAALPEFVAALDARRLVGGVKYNVTGAPDPDTANRIMDRVRAYRP